MLARDSANHSQASHYFQFGIKAAQEAEDSSLGALLLALATAQPISRLDPDQHLHYLDDGFCGFHPREATRMALGYVNATKAQSFAVLGKRDDCLRALDEAENLVEQDNQLEMSARPRNSSPAFPAAHDIAAYRGVSLAILQEPEEAEKALRRTLDILPIEATKLRYCWLPALATACADQENYEEAARIASDALSGAIATGQHRNITLLYVLEQKFQPHVHDPHVQLFLDQLRTVRNAQS
jgi:tetratricopeptide (TPR) repeat protein